MDTELGVKMPPEGGTVDAQRVLQVLQRVLVVLNRAEEAEIGRRGERGETTSWHFTGLQLGSVEVTIAPSRPRHGSTSHILERVMDAVVAGFSQTEAGIALPPRWDRSVAVAGVDLAQYLGLLPEDGVLLRVLQGGRPARQVTVTRRSAEHLRAALGTVNVSLGSVTGKLESMSSHNGLIARLWTDQGKHRVEVRFGIEQTDIVRGAWNKRVAISGRLERDPSGRPVRIRMRALEILPANAPSLSGLSGLDLGLTDGVDAGLWLDQQWGIGDDPEELCGAS